MLKDITIGQYYPTNSLIHQLDPRAKMVFTIFFTIALFLLKEGESYVAFGLILLFLTLLAKIPVKLLLKGLKPLRWILILTFLIHLFANPGQVLYSLGFLEITLEGLQKGISMAIRLIYLILISSLLTLTTSPIALTDGLEKLLQPLQRVKFPAHELALMISIALRFIPTMLNEADKIMKAQKSRGVQFEQGPLLARLKNLVAILVPLVVNSFRRANDLALAMEARCYRGGQGRTKMKELKYGKGDYLTYFCGLLLLLGAGFFG